MEVDPEKTPLQMARRRGDSSFSSSLSLSGLDREASGKEENGIVSPRASESSPSSDVVEDEVDQILWKQAGSIERPKDERLYVCSFST